MTISGSWPWKSQDQLVSYILPRFSHEYVTYIWLWKKLQFIFKAHQYTAFILILFAYEISWSFYLKIICCVNSKAYSWSAKMRNKFGSNWLCQSSTVLVWAYTSYFKPQKTGPGEGIKVRPFTVNYQEKKCRRELGKQIMTVSEPFLLYTKRHRWCSLMVTLLLARRADSKFTTGTFKFQQNISIAS